MLPTGGVKVLPALSLAEEGAARLLFTCYSYAEGAWSVLSHQAVLPPQAYG